METVQQMDYINIANMSTLVLPAPCRCFPASSNENAFPLISQATDPIPRNRYTRKERTHDTKIGAVALSGETGNDAQRTTPTRTVADCECCPCTADLMERRLELVQGDLDARGRVLDVECLREGRLVQ